MAWSEPQAGPRGALTIAEQLHALLQQAEVAGPLLLVGHSAGGLYVRAFAGKYPAEVAGMALVDSSSPEMFRANPNSKERDGIRRARHSDAMWLWLKDARGWQRLSGGCNGDVPKGLEAYANIARAAECRPTAVNSWLGEWDDFESSAEEVANLKCCGELPLLVISQDPDRPSAADYPGNAKWTLVQESLKSLSTRSRRIIARNSGHSIMIDRQDTITGNVGQLIMELRGFAPHSAYGFNHCAVVFRCYGNFRRFGGQ